MEGSMIFGSDVKLPSLPGLQSDCEEELRMLMKEVDLEFERKHHDILQELIRLRELCRSQSNEIENLKSALLSNKQDDKHKHAEQHKNFCMDEIKKLRDEIFHLKNENTVLKRKARLLDENELIMNSMKRSLNIQQEENNLLQGRLSKLIDEHKTLQNRYERLTNIFEQKETFRNEDSNRSNLKFSDHILSQIDNEVERFMAEETEYHNILQSKINEGITELQNFQV